ncbi:MAG: hypothetical protein IMW91_00880 [Firmicutes bacterium]|nr:hypothetical protein [Bacillota bacterium]
MTDLGRGGRGIRGQEERPQGEPAPTLTPEQLAQRRKKMRTLPPKTAGMVFAGGWAASALLALVWRNPQGFVFGLANWSFVVGIVLVAAYFIINRQILFPRHIGRSADRIVVDPAFALDLSTLVSGGGLIASSYGISFLL